MATASESRRKETPTPIRRGVAFFKLIALHLARDEGVGVHDQHMGAALVGNGMRLGGLTCWWHKRKVVG